MSRYVLTEEGARKIREALRSSGKVGARNVSGSKLAFPDASAEPFRVEWAQSVSSGSGAWIIWLPSSILTVNGSVIDPTKDLDEAKGDYPSGWYVLDMISTGSVMLNVRIPSDGTAPTCSFDSSADTAEEEERVIPICVANVSRDSTTDVVTVSQFVRSAVVIDNTSKQEAVVPSPFMVSKTKTTSESGEPVTVTRIVGNSFYFNGEQKTVPDYNVQEATLQGGSVYLNGEYSDANGAWSFAIGMEAKTPSSSERVFSCKLYDFSGGRVAMDYRTTFLVAGDGLLSIAGDDNGNGGAAEKISGEVEFKGAENSGIKVSTSRQNGATIDLDGRESDVFGIHKISDSEGNVVAKFHGTDDVQLGAGSGITADGTFLFITDIDYYDGWIRVKKRTANVANGAVVSVGNETDWQNVIETVPIDV